MDASVEQELKELTLSPEKMSSVHELEKVLAEYRSFRVINLKMFKNLTDRLNVLKKGRGS